VLQQQQQQPILRCCEYDASAVGITVNLDVVVGDYCEVSRLRQTSEQTDV